MGSHNSLMFQSKASREVHPEKKPFAQRVAGPRSARRLNHAFRHLYRHDLRDQRFNFNATNAFDFFSTVLGYSPNEVQDLSQTFPPLLDLNVGRHLRPKLIFLMKTLNLASIEEIRAYVLPHYFGAQLERNVAPKHAFLLHKGLYNRRDVVLNKNRWQEFLLTCHKIKKFCALCNQWQCEIDRIIGAKSPIITVQEIESFEVFFHRGLMAAARDEMHSSQNINHLCHVNLTSAELISLLIQHGANPLELDSQGASLLHWAAGTGCLESVRVLLPHFSKGVFEESERDGALPLHWAAAGVTAKEFGTKGHIEICRYFLNQVDDVKECVNKKTKDGNTALMWSSWAGSLDIVKLLIRNRAETTVVNRNGCSVAHWATSGGNLKCCQYLHTIAAVDFSRPNFGGNTPLTHAIAFGRVDIVEWLRNEVLPNKDEDDMMALSLAKDFVAWNADDKNRRLVLSMFQNLETSVTDTDLRHGESSSA
jgi:ankyrin repeat protein